ncbi:sensor histidine kinase [Quadrisphaera setariae]|uniref:histidine kinase n=1 Tax=Quadrisphaera setariae TaxID=2593304 RepID=A0A5C8ZG83_9ACTN|nr:HAMP domain-containing sensor histidine kinase [Quadrisphaera setariae]TXR56178.1 HAMP domain-containing histidine kinase [Quadrisphaera setariae]
MKLFASLRSRVLVATVALTVITVLTTAWTVSRSVEQALRSQAARSLSNDTDIYQALLDYGGAHTSWDGVDDTVRDLATRYDRRIALKDASGRVLVDSSALLGQHDGPLRPRPDAVVDPYTAGLVSSAPGSLVGAVAPAQPAPSAADVAENAQRIQTASACLRAAGIRFSVDDVGDGTRTITVDGDGTTEQQDETASRCTDPLYQPTASQRAGAEAQNRAIGSCLDRSGTAHRLTGGEDGDTPFVVVDEADPAAVAGLQRCTEQADRASLAPRVALFLGSSDAAALRWDRLTTGSTLAVIAAIIAVASAVALVSTLAITRPLRRLAAAADRITHGDLETRVPTAGRGEVAQVGAAFNTMAEALHRTEAQRQQMVSDIAHELRNPLVTLNGTLEAIQDEVFTASPEVIDSLAEEARQLSHLVKDLAELNAAESGHLRLASGLLDLGEVVRTVAEAHTVVARTAGLTLRLDDQHSRAAGQQHDGWRALVVGDEVRLRQVLTNLVSNAVRYSHPGGTVTITTATTSDAVEVRVADQGVGITAEQLPLVFDRFWRADAARARATGGTGLGLAISRELVHAHHGELTVTSQPGVGTEFVLRLPAAR